MSIDLEPIVQGVLCSRFSPVFFGAICRHTPHGLLVQLLSSRSTPLTDPLACLPRVSLPCLALPCLALPCFALLFGEKVTIKEIFGAITVDRVAVRPPNTPAQEKVQRFRSELMGTIA